MVQTQLETPDSNPEISIVQANLNDKARWDAYVEGNKDSRFFHRFGWSEIIQKSYGYKPYYLMALRDDHLVGVLPLTFVKSMISGNALISTAFTVGGGVIADDIHIAQTLLTQAKNVGEQLGVGYVELRSEKASFTHLENKNTTYAGFVKPLPSDEEAILLSIPRKRRAEIRKAFKFVESGALKFSFERDLDKFYGLYARSLRDLGTPIFPKRFVKNILDVFSDECDLLTVENDGVPVSSLISFYHHDCVMPYYVGATPEARALRAFDYIYWQQMLRAADRGVTQFDFGRSKYDTGSFGYKKTWGIEPQALEYQYQLVKDNTVPDINPNNPKFAVATKVWRKLPLPLANFGGGVLARHFA